MSESEGIAAAAAPIAFVYVRERERALSFYRDRLALRVHSSDDYGDFLSAASGLVRITVIPDHEPSPHPAAGWAVDDIVATAKELQAKGVGLTRYEGMGQDELGISTSPDGGKLAFFADPDGNVLMLVQM